jgi:hypothetical protein
LTYITPFLQLSTASASASSASASSASRSSLHLLLLLLILPRSHLFTLLEILESLSVSLYSPNHEFSSYFPIYSIQVQWNENEVLAQYPLPQDTNCNGVASAPYELPMPQHLDNPFLNDLKIGHTLRTKIRAYNCIP